MRTRKVKEKVIKFFTHNLIKLLSLFVRKNRNIWVFGSWHGNLFVGNSKYLYLYVKETSPDIFAKWITKNKNVYKQIKEFGGEVHLYNSFKAIYYGLIAKVYVYNTGIEDVCHYAVRNARLINVWHGMPLKRLETDEREILHFSPLRRLERKIVWQLTTSQVNGSRIDLVPATSESTRKNLQSGLECSNIKITGQPREDLFYQEIDKKAILLALDLLEFEDSKIVTYLPTFRDRANQYFSFWGDNEPETSKFFENSSQVLILEKSHYHEKDSAAQIKLDYPNYRNLSNFEVETQELLAITDILITDYSSVFIDFLHTNRPIIFFPYDLQSYLNERGLYYDYKQVACGKIVYNTADLLESVSAYLKDPKMDKDKRQKARELFHKYTDGKNCQRVYQEIVRLSYH